MAKAIRAHQTARERGTIVTWITEDDAEAAMTHILAKKVRG